MGGREHRHGPIEHVAHEGLGFGLTLWIVIVVVLLLLIPLGLLVWSLS